MTDPKPLLAMKAIDKVFGNAAALTAASLEVMPAEVMAVVGQNGAGKSTMIKILNGAYRRDAGTIEFDGKAWNAGSPQQAQRAGISTIFQEINLIAYRTVAENIFLGREIKRFAGLLDWKKMNAGAKITPADGGIPTEWPKFHGEGAPCTSVVKVESKTYKLAVPYACYEAFKP